MLLQGGTLSYFLESNSYYTTEKYVMISQKGGQHFGLHDQSKIFFYFTPFYHLLSGWCGSGVWLLQSCHQILERTLLFPNYPRHLVFRQFLTEIVFTLNLCPEKINKNCANISCTHFNHILGMLILVTYAGSTIFNFVIQPFWPCALFPLLNHNGK